MTSSAGGEQLKQQSSVMMDAKIPNKDNNQKGKLLPMNETPPFLGRSQSLLNIPIDLNNVESSVNNPLPAAEQQQATTRQQQRPLLVPNNKQRHNPPDNIKYQSLPHKENQSKANKSRKGYSTVPHRSKSVESKSAQLQQQQQHNYSHNVSQVELFATIHRSRHQSSSVINQRPGGGGLANGKNMTVTSTAAVVGVREQQQQQHHQMSATSDKNKNPSHMCVVQAMVHQDAEVSGRPITQLPAQRPKSFDPIYEPLVGPATCHQQRRSDILQVASGGGGVGVDAASIELTADQVRQLIRAISAAQQVQWPSPGSQPMQLPERDVNVVAGSNVSAARSQQQTAAAAASVGRGFNRSDSFEGHEEAVSLLVDAVREIQQICNAKKGCEHP